LAVGERVRTAHALAHGEARGREADVCPHVNRPFRRTAGRLQRFRPCPPRAHERTNMTKQNKAPQPNQRADENISPQDIGGGPQRGVAVEGSQLDEVVSAPDPDMIPAEDDDDDVADDEEDDDDDDAEGVEEPASVI
jgi:hypothetical protein